MHHDVVPKRAEPADPVRRRHVTASADADYTAGSAQVTTAACELWEDARDASQAAWEQVERVTAAVDAWLKRRL